MRGTAFVIGLLATGTALGAGAWWLRTGDGAVTVDRIGDKVQTVARGRLPAFAATGDVAALYRFAADHGDWLQHIPCTCGCGALGHTSNRACYVKEERGDRITFTSHAAT